MKWHLLESEPTKRLGQLSRESRRTVLYGTIAVGIFFGGFGLWSAVAPLSSAASATGVVVVEGERKKVQHLEGGIVKEILASEGARVEAGQVVLRLDETAALSSRERLRRQMLQAKAAEARLLAERDNHKNFVAPGELVAQADDPIVAEVLASETSVFEARKQAFIGQVSVLNQRIKQSEEEINALGSQVKSEQRQRQLIGEEIKGVEQMLAKGLERKPRLLALQRAAAELDGNRGAHLAQIARAKATISESTLRVLDLSNQRQREAADGLTQAQATLADTQERLRAVEDVLARTEVRAPTAGIVVGMQAHTIGGVIAAGSTIMEIVPQEQNLIIEAQVRPDDIDVVHAGLLAQVRLATLNRRAPTFDGRVTYVSADRFVEGSTGVAYYKAFVQVDAKEVLEWTDTELYPGMPAQVMIITGQRTALGYLLSPMTDYAFRAMREGS